MNTIRQHVPGFVEGIEPAEVEFDSTDDMLAIPFVKLYCHDTAFYRFSVNNTTLLTEYENGYKWFVVGFISDIAKINLPIWEPKYITI